MSFILNMLWFVLGFGLLVFVHELGHLIMAKRAGIYCHEFAIGMGPKIYTFQGKETKYSLRAIPFGGYVAMAGEDINVNSSNIPKERRYDGASVLNRFLVAVAGVVMNFILAFLIFIVVALSTGTVVNKSIIGGVAEGSNAEAMGIEYGDRILKIGDYEVNTWEEIGAAMRHSSNIGKRDLAYTIVKNGQTEESVIYTNPRISIDSIGIADYSRAEYDALTHKDIIGSTSFADPLVGYVQKRENKSNQAYGNLLVGDLIYKIKDSTGTYDISTWHDLAVRFQANVNGDEMKVSVKRAVNGEMVTKDVTIVPYKAETLDALAGISPVNMSFGISPTTEVTFMGTIKGASSRFGNAASMIFKTLVIVFGPSKEAGVNDLGGVLSMFNMTSQAASTGIISFLAFIGLLSVNLGIINLLPIPSLDGGRIVFISIEAITGKKLKPEVENTIHAIGLIVLVAFMVYVLFLDFGRFFG